MAARAVGAQPAPKAAPAARGGLAPWFRHALRTALHLAERVLDVTALSGEPITAETARAALDSFGVHEHGLDEVDWAILRALTGIFAGRAVGLAGHQSRRLQTGLTHHYYVIGAVGVAAIAAILAAAR